jgi:hypothetical protein
MDYNADIPSQLKHLCEQLDLAPSPEALNYYDEGQNHFSKALPVRDSEALRLHDSLRHIRNLL